MRLFSLCVAGSFVAGVLVGQIDVKSAREVISNEDPIGTDDAQMMIKTGNLRYGLKPGRTIKAVIRVDSEDEIRIAANGTHPFDVVHQLENRFNQYDGYRNFVTEEKNEDHQQ